MLQVSRWQQNKGETGGRTRPARSTGKDTPSTHSWIDSHVAETRVPLSRHEVRDCAARRERDGDGPDNRPRCGPGDEPARLEKARGVQRAGRGHQRADNHVHQKPGGAAKDCDGDREDKGQRAGEETGGNRKRKEGVRSKAAGL